MFSDAELFVVSTIYISYCYRCNCMQMQYSKIKEISSPQNERSLVDIVYSLKSSIVWNVKGLQHYCYKKARSDTHQQLLYEAVNNTI